ncbi:MAG TPA: galactonate dehydratase, partial [Armatimonadota bacterium]|nr:galactonate dehydratase [Armatimonadota bacterium]
SGIEQAMWDLLGKSLGVPVYQLLGGACRDRIRMYAHCGGATPEEAAAAARQRVAEGYTALKTGIGRFPARILETPAFVEECAARFAAMREAVGPGIDLAIDFHGQVSPALAIRLAQALEPYHPMFIEEPCLPENVDTLVTVARSTSIPIATGERLFTKWAFREVLEKQAAAVVQPDLCHAGGILEGKKIAAMAECYYAAVAPHNPLGPISLAACLQLDACIPNFLVQEQVSLGEGYLREAFRVVDGYIPLPTGPGLGIELDDEAVAALEGHDWKSPRVYHEDGSVGDW